MESSKSMGFLCFAAAQNLGMALQGCEQGGAAVVQALGGLREPVDC